MFPDTRSSRSRSQSGLTLMEVLLALCVLSVLMVGIGSISIGGFGKMSDQTVERHLDGSTAQIVARTFGRDVQGAALVRSEACGTDGSGRALVTLVASSDRSVITYRDRTVAGRHSLVRGRCTAQGTLLAEDVLVEELAGPFSVACTPSPCATSASPNRVVTLTATRSDRFSFAVSGARRSLATSTPAPVFRGGLFALGGSAPLAVSGNGTLRVAGNVIVNSTSRQAVSVGGANARLTIGSAFRILAGGACSGCTAVNTTPFPVGSFSAPLPDPLAYLPAPTEAGAPTGACTADVCRPGVYASRMSFTRPTRFESGTYLFRRGFDVSGNGTLTGSGVLVFNGCGVSAPGSCAAGQSTLAIAGKAELSLTPMTTGPYAGVLVYQARSNTKAMSITGGAGVMSIAGLVYAPTSDGVTLGAGSGGLVLGSVIATNIAVTGNGTVRIDGV